MLDWTWMGGSNTVLHYGVYGTLGTPAAGNIPGSRSSAVSWTDSSGHLWLFGGYGYAATSSGHLNDLWEFNPSTSQWAWMAGSSTANQSGVYGTLGTPAAGNIPGSRNSAVSWTDSSGHLWLFGGYGYDANGTFNVLNDLWEFNPSTNQWTWVGGSNTVNHAGVYGTLGTPAAGNIPGVRAYGTSWADSTGHLWLFGGQGVDANGIQGILNDLWQFNPSTNQWAWMGGSSTVPQTTNYNGGNAGVYGTLGTPAAGNIPGSRTYAVSWTDSNGHLWLFGGDSYDANGTFNGYLNDLWEFNPSTNQWAWMGGSSTASHAGVYGTLGTPAAGNIPGGRYSAVSWIDGSGHLWLFGGVGDDSTGILFGSSLNDLWEYQLPTTTPTVTVTPSLTSITAAQGLTVTVAVSAGSDSRTATGSVILTGTGGFASNSTALSGGSATINIPAGLLALGSDTFTASYTPDSSSSSTYNSATGTSSAVTVSLITPTITFTVPNHTYGDASFTVSATSNSSGAITYSVVSGSATISGSTVTLTGAGSVVLQASQVAAGNYTAGTQTATVTVATESQTITFTAPTSPVNYGVAPITLSASASSGLAVAFNVVSGPGTVSGSTLTITGVGTVVVAANQAGNTNYAAATQVTQSIVVNQATQTITFTAPTSPVTYGVSPITLSATGGASGNAVVFSVVSGPGTISGSTLTITGVGTVVVAANQAGNANYSVATQVTRSIVVNQATQTISFTAPTSPVTYGVSPIALVATGGASSNAVVFSVVSGPATVSGTTLTITGAGTVVVAANQTGNTNYSAATQVTQSIVVNQASQTITFTAPTSPVTYGVSPITLSATGGASSNAMVFSVVSGPATVSGNTLTITGAGTVVVAANQAGNTNYSAATQVTQSIVVNQAAQTITFTAPTSPVTYGVSPITLSATGGASGSAVVFSVVSGPGTISGSTLTITGAGTVVVAANQAGNANYVAATQVTQSIVVNVIGVAATPTFSPVAGTYTVAQTVTISDATAGATIYYTTNSTTPTTSSTVYSGAIPISSTQTIEAIATDTGYSTSIVASAAYTIANPLPAISGISPAITDAGGTVFTLTVNGSGFIASSTVYWGTSALTTTYLSATQLTAQVPAADISTAGTNAISVQNPAPGGGTSNAWQFEVDTATGTATIFASTTETVAAGSTASYPVTVPSSVTSVSVSCLNLPAGASCSYSSTTNAVTIATSSTTPAGTYQIIVVFTETVTSTAFLLPILLLPLGFMRKKLAARGIWLTACLGLVLMATAALSIGCGGGSSPPPATHQVTSSGAVSLTIQ
jgi:N-acetylneuraminic acid mutarotase